MTTLLERRGDSPDEIPSDDEIDRQDEMMRVLERGARPTTLLGWKAAAIGGYARFDSLLLTRVALTLPEWEAEGRLDPVGEFLLTARTRNRLRKRLELARIKLTAGHVIRLPRKTARPVIYPQGAVFYDGPPLELVPADPVSLAEFESLCFENRVAARYLNVDDFPRYLFENLMFSLGARQLTDLAGRDQWQARLAVLLDRTDYCPNVATTVFYADSVAWGDMLYDCSFVPKYNVLQLRPQSWRQVAVTDEAALRYRAQLDVHRERTVPERWLPAFRAFPFKEGHLIRPTGQIVQLSPGPCPRRLSNYRLVAQGTACDPARLEDSAAALAAATDPGDMLEFAAFQARSETEHALALMTLRRMHGPTMRIGPGSMMVDLPTDRQLLSWVNRYMPCAELNPREVLPPLFGRETVQPIAQLCSELIRDLAASCVNKWGASILCGAYALPAVAISRTLDLIERKRGVRLEAVQRGDGGWNRRRLSSSNSEGAELEATAGYAELYVALTLVLQENHLLTLQAIRNRLGEPVFGRASPSAVDWSRYDRLLASARPMPASWLPGVDPQDRIEPIVLPTALASQAELAAVFSPIDASPAAYRFRHPQLAQLARYGERSLALEDRDQMARLIAIALENSPLVDDDDDDKVAAADATDGIIEDAGADADAAAAVSGRQ